MFKRVLVANRGEVAVRIARACRKLDIAPIGIVSDPDRGASWTSAFEEVIPIGPASADRSYLDPARVLQAARQSRCAALHPGWGFLAEDARFAALCRQFGIYFIGPPAAIVHTMGKKTPARAAMERVGLAVVPGTAHLLADLDEAAHSAQAIGYPVMLKADAGGGGRGMRVARDEEELCAAFPAAVAEARSAFGEGAVYLERFLEGGRHIEIQVLCDSFGNGIHLGERECSIQRKHQKLIEESPSPALSTEQRADLGQRAVAAALAVGYVGAGTIEFLRDDSGELLFLEMNTRLQVEHPVTEMVWGLDLPVEQIRIAAGHGLNQTQDTLQPGGHALECRINAEDPENDFQPSPGVLKSFHFPLTAGSGRVRVDTHLTEGDEVSPHYDSLLAKIITHGETRADAIAAMQETLAGARVEGIATTIPLHQAVLESEAFQSGNYNAGEIPGWPQVPSSPPLPTTEKV